MVKIKRGNEVKEVPEGSLKWYLMTGWEKVKKTETNNKKTSNS